MWWAGLMYRSWNILKNASLFVAMIATSNPSIAISFTKHCCSGVMRETMNFTRSSEGYSAASGRVTSPFTTSQKWQSATRLKSHKVASSCHFWHSWVELVPKTTSGSLERSFSSISLMFVGFGGHPCFSDEDELCSNHSIAAALAFCPVSWKSGEKKKRLSGGEG